MVRVYTRLTPVHKLRGPLQAPPDREGPKQPRGHSRGLIARRRFPDRDFRPPWQASNGYAPEPVAPHAVQSHSNEDRLLWPNSERKTSNHIRRFMSILLLILARPNRTNSRQ